MATALSQKSYQIRELNDELRTTLCTGRVMLTSGVQVLEEGPRSELRRAVQQFDGFEPANDPYGEHDVGRVVVGTEGYFWKIDYYDVDLRYHSPDPADAAVTTRVLTIMREDEY
ncbi:DUF3768 domain-containing protein [Sinorhizobium meliloti]|uniref:DUF3768 domain-containing protein n=1 Tax=Rhizobium meliloti TaxID=382 RepID=UPI000FD9263D|nr:DUF3768 domain-containing protein [Sinorhizobium meliloti]RVG23664.1 DUF3768 domain-containing protein [Sinorhizobium meliloti]